MNHDMKADKYEISVNYKVTNEGAYQSLMLERSLSSSPVRVPRNIQIISHFLHTRIVTLKKIAFFVVKS